MSDLADILPEFARDRAATLRDLSEKRAKMFEEWSEEQRRQQLDAINKIIAAANDAQPGTTVENVAPANPDLAELQKALELRGVRQDPVPSLESQIRKAKDLS